MKSWRLLDCFVLAARLDEKIVSRDLKVEYKIEIAPRRISRGDFSGPKVGKSDDRSVVRRLIA